MSHYRIELMERLRTCEQFRDECPCLDAANLIEAQAATIASLQKELAERTAERDDLQSRYNKACVDIDAKDYRAEAAEARADTLARRVEKLEAALKAAGNSAGFQYMPAETREKIDAALTGERP